MSHYKVYVTPHALAEIKYLPGHVRQRIKQAIRALADNPRPSQSKALNLADSEHELHRLRLERWRIVYLIAESDHIVDVLAVRRRPPYDYGDLGRLIEEAR